MTGVSYPNPVKAGIRGGFSGALSGLFVGLFFSLLLAIIVFVTGLVMGQSLSIFGLDMHITEGGGFQFTVDIRPSLVTTGVCLAVGAIVGAVLAVKQARKRHDHSHEA